MSELLCTETATVMMPRKLTAENGAKAALSGEFFAEYIIDCPDCDTAALQPCLCKTCGDSGIVTQRITINWPTIKAIYAKAVETLGT